MHEASKCHSYRNLISLLSSSLKGHKLKAPPQSISIIIHGLLVLLATYAQTLRA